MANINGNNLYGLIYNMCKNMSENATLILADVAPNMVYFKYMLDCLNMGYLTVSMANTLKINNPGKEEIIDKAKTTAQAMLIRIFLDEAAATKKMGEYDDNATYDFDGKSAKDSPYLDKFDNEVIAEVICFAGEYTEDEICKYMGDVLRQVAAEIDEAIKDVVIE
ncbi:MAG: hypothetical protein KBS66_05735 [Eubacterium sp.]|nr:hypothetical protein [Candidatus Colimonas fimequi]